MGGEKDNQYRVVRAQCLVNSGQVSDDGSPSSVLRKPFTKHEPRSVFIVLLGREEAAPLGFPIIEKITSIGA